MTQHIQLQSFKNYLVLYKHTLVYRLYEDKEIDSNIELIELREKFHTETSAFFSLLGP